MPLIQEKYTCQDCRIKHIGSWFCSTCRKCRRTCQCRKRAAVGQVRVPRVKGGAIGSSSMVINSTRAVGLEVELSNFGTWHAPERATGRLIDTNGSKDGPYYHIDHDGSVTSRREAVIEPLSGDQGLIWGLNCLASHVYMHGCQVDNTCGYHVHVDARDFYWADIQKLMTLWVSMERANSLWTLAGRQPTNFSRTWRSWLDNYEISINDYMDAASLDEFKNRTIRALYGQDTSAYVQYIKAVKQGATWRSNYAKWEAESKVSRLIGRPTKPKIPDYVPQLNQHLAFKANRGWNRAVPSRYLDLNIHSWLYRGTVEFRLGNGTVDVMDIRMWPLFCVWLIEAVSRTNLKYIRDLASAKDPIVAILKHGGVPVPSITGTRLFPMPQYLIDWANNKLNKKGDK